MSIDHLDCWNPSEISWTGRDDGLPNERFHHLTKALAWNQLNEHQKGKHALLGFCSDEGVKRNLGRIGASKGPLKLRESFKNLALDPHFKQEILDLGDVCCHSSDLEKAQKQLGVAVSHLQTLAMKTVVLGGGHETAWGVCQGLMDLEDLAIINLDAHFDLRSLLEGGKGSSGTPFWQMAQACEQSQKKFNYTVLGVQAAANTSSLFARADKLGVRYLSAQQMREANGSKTAHHLVDEILKKHKTVYLSICLDVFAQAFAPGVSAPQALGLFPEHLFPLIQKVAASGKLLIADIVELNPHFDRDEQTARLGASILANILSNWK